MCRFSQADKDPLILDFGDGRVLEGADLDESYVNGDFAELQRISGLEKQDEAFEAIARLDHPDAEAVLAMIGKHARDKTTAKAARLAQYAPGVISFRYIDSIYRVGRSPHDLPPEMEAV